MKRVTSLRGPSLRAPGQQSLSLLKKYQSGGEPLATQCPIWLARDLNLKPPAPVANALHEICNHHGASSTTIVNTVQHKILKPK